MREMLVGSADVSVREIARREEELRAAQLTADVAELDRLISDDLLFTGPDGRLSTKSQDLELYRSGIVRFQSHEPEELRVRLVNENAAISALKARLTVEVNGTLHSGTFRYTRVWAREDGDWRVAGGHVSEVQL